MEWISVKDRLPEIGEKVLSYSVSEGIKETKYTTYSKGSVGYEKGKKDCWFEWITHNNFCWHHEATHWIPLPKLPIN